MQKSKKQVVNLLLSNVQSVNVENAKLTALKVASIPFRFLKDAPAKDISLRTSPLERMLCTLSTISLCSSGLEWW